MKTKEIIIAVLLISFIIVARILPHLPNVAPVAAAALVAGVYLGRKWALIVPLVGMLMSDILLGFYNSTVMLAVYGSFLLIGLVAWLLKNNKSAINIITASLVSSILFFFLTNLAVWLASDWYTRDLAGFLLTYELAVPFFRNTLVGDLLYVGVLFTIFESVEAFSRQKLARAA